MANSVDPESQYLGLLGYTLLFFFSVSDSRVKWSEDLTHEIRPNKEVFAISNTSIAPHVCAMLNSGKTGVVFT